VLPEPGFSGFFGFGFSDLDFQVFTRDWFFVPFVTDREYKLRHKHVA